MKRLLMALALTCVLSGSVWAGDIDTAGAPAPAQSSSVTTTVILTIISLVIR
jgi:hypothetical protein